MGIFTKIKSLFVKKRLDDETLSAMEESLIAADIAPEIAADAVKKLRAKFRPDNDTTDTEIKSALTQILRPNTEKLTAATDRDAKIILVIGVNGAGKTTTIGKLAKKWTDVGKSVVIGACDTFRAAAGEQLTEWATRANAKLVCGVSNDPAATAYAAIEQGAGADKIILDTAGRLHNRADLMAELEKMIRVIKKIAPNGPDEIWLVLDAMTGQNALNQIEFFNRVAPLTGLVITKMDSSSRGGFLISYAAREKNPLPIVRVGYGEKIGDLREFDVDEYLKKLLD
ncbi:MAG: signal recognition particle-docking protein FtsY [Rickettsiales bacterium]|jgi:fused signal recognition particle receptor|nr:signal recognition particle-docking protein FtsY [Rickettsiales bacterium]